MISGRVFHDDGRLIHPLPVRSETLPAAPSDVDAAKAWTQIMAIAERHCLIVQAYGGVATLAMPDEQRASGIRERVLLAHRKSDRAD